MVTLHGNIVTLYLIENMQRRATLFRPEINELDYQERVKKLNLLTLA